MRQKIIEKNLKRVLLEDGPFADALFRYELEEHVEDYKLSKRTDGDDYLIALTENSNDVAMLLIDENDKVHSNENARSLLKKLWQKNYQGNLERLIPDMASELDSGYLYYFGVKVKGSSRKIGNSQF